MALPWHKGSHQLLTDGFAPPSECPRCCSQEAHPGFCRLVSARNRKDGGALWSGRLFWCQREGGASGAPGPAAGAAAACPSQDAFVCCFPEHTESPAPWSVAREEGILSTPQSQGAAIQRGPVMLPSFLLAACARSRCPGRGATGRERSHAASQCSEVGQLHTDPLCPHRLGTGTSGGTPGRLWQR